MKIYVDADGSPVKDTTIAIAALHHLEVILVTNYAHFSQKDYPSHVNVIYVDMGADLADYKIASLIQKGDILVTQDYGLASITLAKARVIHQTGKEYTRFNIERLLSQRAESSKMRRNGKHTKGPKAFTEDQRQAFIDSLEQLIQEEITKNK